ncbi:MAG TPA: PilZ domain-containing protein [Terriglobia bacterium]|nr:PilZ domain-containing protein [Terriglobia bacterium]
MQTSGIEKRRSDRLSVKIPVHVAGIDPNGETVEYEGSAAGLNRHGARIKIPWPLDCGHPVRVRTVRNKSRPADFRLLPIISPQSDIGNYGIECLDEKENFWGIEFPDSGKKDEEDARVLLECGVCHTMALFSMSILEIDALRTIGMVGKPCRTCRAETPYRYADLIALEGESNWMISPHRPMDRGHKRVYMQLPVEVRNARGEEEVTRTENISKSGFCFASEIKFYRGEKVQAVFPFDPVSKRTELGARIIRARAIEGSHRKFYGARFVPLPTTRIPGPRAV